MNPESNIPVLRLDFPKSSLLDPQPHADAAAAKLYNDSHAAILKLSTDSGRAGTGFLIEDGTHLLTSARNVLGSKEQFAVANDGKRYKLEIEKIDDLTDMALLKLTKGKIPGTTTLSLGETKDLTPDDKVYALSAPADSSKAYLSPGYLRGLSSPMDFLFEIDSKVPEIVMQNISELDKKSGEDAVTYLSQPMVDSRIHLEKGSMGAPVFDQHGKVVSMAVLANSSEFSKGQTLLAPIESAQELLKSDGKFEFKYRKSAADWAESFKSDLKEDQIAATVKTGLAAGVSYLGYKAAGRNPLMATAMLGTYGLTRLSSDANHFLQSTERADGLKYGLSSVADLGTVTGAAMMLSESMRGRGLLLAGIGIAGRAATDFIRNRWVLDESTRKDGDKSHPAFRLDSLLKS